MNFDLIVAMWGDSIHSIFERVAFPSLCAPGNIPALAAAGRVTLWLYVPAGEAAGVDLEGYRARLPAAVEVAVVPVADIGGSNLVARNYLDLSVCHRLAVAKAGERNAALCFLPADGIWADGSLRAMAAHLAAGRRAVLTNGIRIAAETFLPVYIERFLAPDLSVARCPGRALVAAVMPHLHRLTLSTMIDSPTFTTWPSLVTWPVAGEDGLITRLFHLHPAMVWPRRYGDFTGTVDHGLIEAAMSRTDDICVVTDSDEALQVNLDVLGHRDDLIGTAPASIETIAAWIPTATTPLHRWFFLNAPIRLHERDLNTAWAAVEERSRQFAAVVVAAAERRLPH